MAEIHQKFKSFFTSAESLILWACDTNAQDMLQQLETSKDIFLDVSKNDPQHMKLVENVIDILGKDTSLEKLHRYYLSIYRTDL